MGVISSGAAVEYEIIDPPSVIEITPTRKTSDAQTAKTLKDAGIDPLEEIEREKAWVAQLEKEERPSFGSFKLEAVPHSISQGVFLYKTTGTNLPGGMSDYVIFGASVNKTLGTAEGLGMSPLDNPSLLVSLITGNAYNSQRQFLQRCSGVLYAFESAHPISNTTKTLISQATATYFKKLSAPITFKNVAFKGQSQSFQNGGHVYSSKPLTPLLKTGLDYYVFAQLDTNNHYIAYGLKLDAKNTKLNGLISLVSGNIYGFFVNGKRVTSLAKQTLSNVMVKSLTSNGLYSSLYSIYQSRIGSSLFTTIQNQSIAYQVALQKANRPKPISPPTPPKKPPVSQPTQHHSKFWELMHGGSTGGDTSNFNELINAGGDFDTLGGP